MEMKYKSRAELVQALQGVVEAAHAFDAYNERRNEWMLREMRGLAPLPSDWELAERNRRSNVLLKGIYDAIQKVVDDSDHPVVRVNAGIWRQSMNLEAAVLFMWNLLPDDGTRYPFPKWHPDASPI